MSHHYLSIDNGTQSLRAIIFDGEGQQVAKVRIPFNPYDSAHPGWAEQDADLYWSALCEACQKLWQEPGVDKSRIKSVAITAQRGTVVNVDKEGKPLRPAILWLDQRTTDGLKPIGGLWGLLFKIVGVTDTIAQLQANAESNWIRNHQPEIWQKTHKLLLISGYLNYRLTGLYRDSVGCQVAYMPFDYKKQRWASKAEWKWDALGIERDMLPELVAPGDALGVITKQAAALTGIPEGLTVISGAADKACEILGAGSLTPEIGCLSYGTTATYNITTEKYVEAVPFIPPYPAAVPNAYSSEVQIFRGYWMVEWFKQEFGAREIEAAIAAGRAPESLLEELIKDIPPGSEGLLLQPYWTPGIRIPGPEARGTVMGFTDVHTRGHLYRAILEGLAYALREGKERIERRAGRPVSSLRVSGGGSQSDTAMQITADIFGLPTVRPHTYETSGLGAAMLQAVASGEHDNYQAAVDAMTHVAQTFEPIEANRRHYDALYREVYLKMYKRMKPLYETLRKLG